MLYVNSVMNISLYHFIKFTLKYNVKKSLKSSYLLNLMLIKPHEGSTEVVQGISSYTNCV